MGHYLAELWAAQWIWSHSESPPVSLQRERERQSVEEESERETERDLDEKKKKKRFETTSAGWLQITRLHKLKARQQRSKVNKAVVGGWMDCLLMF